MGQNDTNDRRDRAFSFDLIQDFDCGDFFFFFSKSFDLD